jgi:hypothetical protein
MTENPMQERTFGALVSELAKEARAFINLRMQILREELASKVGQLGRVTAMIVLAVTLLVGSCFLFIASLVVLLATTVFSGSHQWLLSTFTAAMVCVALGAAAAYLARKTILKANLVPNRTLSVLRDDKQWVNGELQKAL